MRCGWPTNEVHFKFFALLAQSGLLSNQTKQRHTPELISYYPTFTGLVGWLAGFLVMVSFLS